MHQIITIGKELSSNWIKHRNSSMAAAIAYRSLFSLAPILVLIAMILSLFQESYILSDLVDNYTPRVETVNSIDQLIQEISNTAEIQNLIKIDKAGIFIVIIIMIYGASTVFKELSLAINGVWEITEKSSVKYVVFQRALGAIAVLGIVALLIGAALLNWFIAQIQQLIGILSPNLASLSSILSYAIIPILIFTTLSAIYKGMPRTKISFKDVYPASILTSILMWLGVSVAQFIVGFMNNATYWGAAGSLVVFLMGVYYLSMVVLLGAEFTKVYCYRWGSRKKKRV